MPSIAKEQKEYYKSRIRSVIAQHPQITQVALRERLKDGGLELDRWYVASLLKEIQVERVKRLNTLTLAGGQRPLAQDSGDGEALVLRQKSLSHWGLSDRRR
jgi:hypothetical protein